MSPVTDIVTGVIGQGVASSFNNGIWTGSLNYISPLSGYWVKVSDTACDNPSCDLCILDAIRVEPDINYNLNEGPNLISFPSDGSALISAALPDEIEDLLLGIIGQGLAATNGPDGWQGSLSSFNGGKGYWFLVDLPINSSVSFAYDLSTLSRINVALEPEELEGYEYNQSSQQAFYFIESVENIEIGDWILSYNGDEVIGAREWTGDIIDVPAMGSDGSDYTKGYIETGSVPSFKILKDGELITLEGDIPTFENNQLYMVSSLTEAIPLPESFSLDRAYPNPFNPTTTLSFAIPVDSEVSLSIYNLQGREVARLINGNMDAGYHSIVWDANSYSSGVYFVKMVAGEFVNTQKLMLIK
jgi:hypothetical protein